MTLSEIIAAASPRDGGFSVFLDDDWMQGRTVYGGMSSALAHEAARSIADDLPLLRTAQIAFIGPLAGEVTARSELLRRGRNAVSVRTELFCEGNLALTAIFIFMHARPSTVDHGRTNAPQVPAPDACETARHPMRRSFADKFEWRYSLPKQAGEADVSRWVRLKHRDGIDPATEMLVVGDSLPAAGLMLFDGFVPLSSVNWTVNLTGDGACDDGWFLMRSRSEYVRDGISSQSMQMWDSAGRPLMAGMQSVVFFG